MKEMDMDLPFDGAISQLLQERSPEGRPQGHRKPRQGSDPSRPLSLPRGDARKRTMKPGWRICSISSCACRPTSATGKRLICLFEGRDAAGKGGTIDALHENLNPRGRARWWRWPNPPTARRARMVLPALYRLAAAGGEIAIFDRCGTTAAMVEHVFGFCTDAEQRHVSSANCPISRTCWSKRASPC